MKKQMKENKMETENHIIIHEKNKPFPTEELTEITNQFIRKNTKMRTYNFENKNEYIYLISPTKNLTTEQINKIMKETETPYRKETKDKRAIYNELKTYTIEIDNTTKQPYIIFGNEDRTTTGTFPTNNKLLHYLLNEKINTTQTKTEDGPMPIKINRNINNVCIKNENITAEIKFTIHKQYNNQKIEKHKEKYNIKTQNYDILTTTINEIIHETKKEIIEFILQTKEEDELSH